MPVSYETGVFVRFLGVNMEYNEAKKILLKNISVIDTEKVDLDFAYKRVLGCDLISNKNVPNFNRSPLDGYCFNYEDTIGVTTNNPKIFDVIEEVPCGKVAKSKLGKNQTIKVLTGAKLPEGANCVIKFEDIELVDGKLKLSRELKLNENVILIGEDVKEGIVLSKKGTIVDMGVVGIAASLGLKEISVYKKITVGFISTGEELLEVDEKLVDGKIYNSNRYIFRSIFENFPINYKYYGIAVDDVEALKSIYKKASDECDIVISTGGVSVGDYDYTYRTLEELGFNILVNRINMKPGMACCFANKGKKLILGLSGNPMSSVTTFYAVCLPAIKKMMGYCHYENEYFKVKLKNSFNKTVKGVRFLRVKVDIEDGAAVATLNLDQGNIVIKSLIGCNGMIRVENCKEVKEGMIFDCMYL